MESAGAATHGSHPLAFREMIARKKFRLRLPSRTLALGERTLLMGVVNVTPDSFSGDGLHLDTKAALARALEMERDGADIIDIGGESTRPGAEWLAADEDPRPGNSRVKILWGP